MFGLPAGSEIIVLLVVVLLLFGGSRLAGMGKGAGRAIREFKDEVKGPEAAKAEDKAIEPIQDPVVRTEPVRDKVADPLAAEQRSREI